MLFYAKNPQQAKQLAAQTSKGELIRIAKGVYSNDSIKPISEQILADWMHIVSHYLPTAILSHRTALELTPTANTVFLTGPHKRRLVVHGLVINCIAGDTSTATQPLLPYLFRSIQERAVLENLSLSRARKGVARALGQQAIEEYLAEQLARYGSTALQALNDKAQAIADALGLQDEMRKLDAIIAALLGTQTDKASLRSHYARAVARREPYDKQRLHSMEQLAIAVQKVDWLSRPFAYTRQAWSHLSFFEAYFSNYIEGTEFAIEEAEDIVFKRQTIGVRHADSHDVIAVYDMTSDMTEMVTTPQSAKELITMLQSRHAAIVAARPDKRPGEFKTKINRAGNTWFVQPDDVVGTLTQSFALYSALPEGMSRAMFMQFLIAEVHPFDDGNGRLSRIMMNAELVAAGETKIIIPTVYRDSYLNGLRHASQQQRFATLLKVLDLMQAYTASIDWSDYGMARDKIEHDAADQLPDQGVVLFNRALRELKRSADG